MGGGWARWVSENLIAQVDKADVVVTEMMMIYREFDVELLIETACVKEEDFRRVEQLVGSVQVNKFHVAESEQCGEDDRYVNVTSMVSGT